MTVRRKSFTIAQTGESKPMNVDDQVLVSGLLEAGRASIHYRGGVSRGTPLGDQPAPRAICNSPPQAAKPRSSR